MTAPLHDKGQTVRSRADHIAQRMLIRENIRFAFALMSTGIIMVNPQDTMAGRNRDACLGGKAARR
jgi:hypothetical protein